MNNLFNSTKLIPYSSTTVKLYSITYSNRVCNSVGFIHYVYETTVPPCVTNWLTKHQSADKRTRWKQTKVPKDNIFLKYIIYKSFVNLKPLLFFNSKQIIITLVQCNNYITLQCYNATSLLKYNIKYNITILTIYLIYSITKYYCIF